MELELIRFSSGKNDTLGILFRALEEPKMLSLNTILEHEWLCFILEDEFRVRKVRGETRIPAGRYRVTLRAEGDMHDDYSRRFPGIHKGMLWIREVPDFEWIYFHIGNKESQTDGCLLTSDSAQQNITQDGYAGSSEPAYLRIYPPIAESISRGEEVWLTVVDYA